MAPTATAGNTTSGQFKAGPGYGSAASYGSYEPGPDGYKVSSTGGYSATPAQTKSGGTPTTSADLTPMYSKGHASLNKVNVSTPLTGRNPCRFGRSHSQEIYVCININSGQSESSRLIFRIQRSRY